VHTDLERDAADDGATGDGVKLLELPHGLVVLLDGLQPQDVHHALHLGKHVLAQLRQVELLLVRLGVHRHELVRACPTTN
jgi:hypothetical protein